MATEQQTTGDIAPAFHGRGDSGGIYAIRNVVTGDVYIGSASRFSSRFASHKSRLGRGNHHNAALQADFVAHGARAFVFEVVAVIPDGAERVAVEEASIEALFGTGCYNATPVCPPVHTGLKRSPETRARIREVQRNRSPETVAAHFGRKVSDETRARMRAAQLGKSRGPLSAEHKAKISAAQRGRKLSPENAAKLRASRLGAVHSAETREKCAFWRGKKLSAEHRAKVGAAALGRRHTPEAKAKIAAARRARKK